MMTLGAVTYLTQRISIKYINHVTHHLSSAGISIIFHKKSANFLIPRNTDILAFEHIISNSFDFF